METLMLRAPKLVAQRAGAVYCIVARQGIESMLKAMPERENQVEESCSIILETSQSPILKEEITKKESRLLGKPPGRWTEKDVAKQERRWEALGVLAWALKAPSLSMPPFDEHFNRQQLFREVFIGGAPVLPDFVATLAANGLRSEDEIRLALEQAQFWQWRAHMQVLHPDNVAQDEDQPKKGCHDVEEYEGRLKMGAEDAKVKGALTSIINNDFGVFGTTAYRDLDKGTLGALASISQTRLFTLGWIAGIFDWLE
eukprot:comp20769_c0_seq1/m.27261 comp20769_c0_seq1/g.27261  ORF comp20769_c0_seq1/g.27261 comp20769_c0_seq1/m.27261 type:complete len:256 (-) comp20769_c0_seq1:73-840(-)